MAKARKKSAAKAKRKRTRVGKKRRKVPSKKSKLAARKKTARKAKPRGIIAKIVSDYEAIVDMLADAENLHRKLEPKISREPE